MLFICYFNHLKFGLKRLTNCAVSTDRLPSNDRYLHLIFKGGLGNHLWMYASLYGIALMTVRTPFACIKHDLRKLFPNLSLSICPKNHCKSPPVEESLFIKETSFLHYDIEMLETLTLSDTSNAIIEDYFQNMRYFTDYIEEIRQEFVLKEEFQTMANQYLLDVLYQEGVRRHHKVTINTRGQVLLGGYLPVFVVIHIRRGDMLKHPYTHVPNASYFHNGMNYYKRKHGEDVVFIVISNDPVWSTEHLEGAGIYFTGDLGKRDREEDFAIGVACNHTLMSVGTYGWWISFLAGGEVVYYRDWPTENATKWYRSEEYFPSYWKPMV